jgi:hypothetical protein
MHIAIEENEPKFPERKVRHEIPTQVDESKWVEKQFIVRIRGYKVEI